MRDLLISFLVFGGLAASTLSGELAILILNWICFMRIYDFSWGIWHTLPAFKIALLISIMATFFHHTFRLKTYPFVLHFLFFYAWMSISCITAYNSAAAWDLLIVKMSTLPVMCVFLASAIHSLNLINKVFWVVGLSLGLIGAKAGFMTIISGGGTMQEGTSGFAGDNNGFALALCLIVAILFGLYRQLNSKWSKSSLLAIIGLIVMAILFTKSRGGFLSISIIFLFSIIASRNKIRNLLIFCAILVLGFFFVPRNLFDRLDTLTNIEEDSSATHRLDYWIYAWEYAVDNPIVGIGLNNFISYTKSYHPNPDDYYQVVHNTYMQVLSETGFIGLALYLSILGVTFKNLIWMYRTAVRKREEFPEYNWIAYLSFWCIPGLLGYCFGSAFLNMIVYDLPWYFIWYCNLMKILFEQDLLEAESRALTG